MAKTIMVCGYGPGISEAVARRFGREGYAVALVARNRERVQAGARALVEAGVHAGGFACDLGDPVAVGELVTAVRSELGPIATIHYNAYATTAGDLTSCDATALRTVFDVGVVGCVTAVQKSLGDLRDLRGSLLVTGGGFCFYDAQVDQMAVQFGAAGLALAKAAQHKLVGLLGAQLAPDVYVGEVVVAGMVKGTAFDSGQATLEPDAIADQFWKLETERHVSSVTFGG